MNARDIVRKAADAESSASEWLRRDERGSWERCAQAMIDETAARRAELRMSDEAAAAEMADRLVLLALRAMIADGKKQKGKR
jgi:hypothetical protein